MKLLKLVCAAFLLGVGTRFFLNTQNVVTAADAAILQSGKHGTSQSPIDLKDAYEVDLRDIEFHYRSDHFSVINTGYFLRLDPKDTQKSFIVVDGERYDLVEFHFHTPSEHLVEGKRYPMEAHFVHKNKEGHAAVVGVLFEDGGVKNKAFTTLINNLPDTIKVAKNIPQPIELHDFLPKDKRVYRYMGSLTTPAYLEGVKWLVMKNPVSVADSQLKKLHVVMGKNDRAVQPLNKRAILVDSTIDKDCVMEMIEVK